MPYVKYKPTPHEKVERNDELYRLRKDEKLTFRELGERFKITDVAAFRIFKRMKARKEKNEHNNH